MSETFPSHVRVSPAGTSNKNGPWDNVTLRIGEVKRIVHPADLDSRTGKFMEYDVMVQHRENSTAITQLYHNCCLLNPLAGRGDFARWLLRVDPSVDIGKLGDGSKVAVLCVDGSDRSALIIGGVRDHRGTDTDIDPSIKAQLDFVYNGASFKVFDDGAVEVRRAGPSTAAGEPRTDDEEKTGPTLKLTADGSFRVDTQGGQSLVLDQGGKAVSVTADQDLILTGRQIHVGGVGADEAAVLGNTLVQTLGQLIDALVNLTTANVSATHISAPPGSPTTPPVNAADFVQIGVQLNQVRAQLNQVLSQFVFVKRAP